MLIILGYFGLTSTYTILMHSNYNAAADSFIVIAQRTTKISLLGALLVESLSIHEPKYICSDDINKKSLYEEISLTILKYEQFISDYQKSSKMIYTDYKIILKDMNSDKFCDNFENHESNLSLKLECRSIDNGILQKGLSNYIHRYVQIMDDITGKLCNNWGEENIMATFKDPRLQLLCIIFIT